MAAACPIERLEMHRRSLRQRPADLGGAGGAAGLCRDPGIRDRRAGQCARERHRALGPHHVARAAGSVLVVAEKQVDSAVFEAQPESTLVPYFMVQAYAVAPGSAWPGSCWPAYAIDYPAVEACMDKNNELAAHLAAAKRRRPAMAEQWSGFSYIVTNLARFIRPDEITFSGVNSTMPMLACLLAKRAYDWDYVYINVAGGVDPRPSHVPLSSSDPVLAEHGVDLRQRGFLRSVHARPHGPDLPGRGPDRWRGLRQTPASATGTRPRSACRAAEAARSCCPRRGAPAPGAPSTRRARWCPGWISSPHGAAFMASSRRSPCSSSVTGGWPCSHGIRRRVSPRCASAPASSSTPAARTHRAAHAGRGARLARAGPEGQFERDAAVTLR